LSELHISGRELPFKPGTGGIVAQMLNTWLRSYEIEKLERLEKRVAALENLEPEYPEQELEPLR